MFSIFTMVMVIDDDGEGKAPAIDFMKIFGSSGGLPPFGIPKNSQKKKNDEPKKENKKKFLSMYCTSLSDKAANGKLDSIIGRDRELERVMQILCRRQKNNPCLISKEVYGYLFYYFFSMFFIFHFLKIIIGMH